MSIIDKPIVKTLMLKGEKGDPGDLDSTAIVDNLTTNRADKVLSAKQGKVLKDLVDANKIVSDHGIINLNSALALKANTADVASEYATKESVNDNISSLDAKVNSLASGSPLVASSISDMTDTTRSYVNTSNGHWYWYNGNSWEDGGVYQATEDSNSVSILNGEMSTFNKLNKYYNLCTHSYYAAEHEEFRTNNARVSLPQIQLAEKDMKLRCNKDYMFVVMLWENQTISNDNLISDSGWVNYFEIEAGAYFTFTLRKSDYSNMDIEEVVNIFDEDFTVNENIKYNLKDVINLKNGIETFRDYADFKISGLTNGEYMPNQFYNVSNLGFLKFDRPIKLTANDGYRFGIHSFVDGSFYADSGWQYSSYTIPANTEFKICIGKGGFVGTADVNEFVSKITFSTKIQEQINELNENISIKPYLYNYFGNKISLNKNVFEAKKIIDYSANIWGSNAWAGGMSIVNDIVFIGYNRGRIAAFDLNTHELIATGQSATYSDDNHYNNLSFSNIINNNNELPLIYTSKCHTGDTECFVEQYLINDGVITSNLIQTIKYTGTAYLNGTADCDWVIDNDNNYLYRIYNSGLNIQKFVKFNIPSLENSVVELTDNDVLDTIDVQCGVRQGSCIYDNKIFILSCLANDGYLNIVDINTKQSIAIINIKDTFSVLEPEGLSVYKNKIYVNMHVLNDIEAKVYEINTNI